MPEWTIGRLNGECVLAFWRDGKRTRYRLGTHDAREAQRLAPALYAELTRPKGKSVADLWEGYNRDMAGRAVIATMRHTWKALAGRFGAALGDAITIADCRAHIAERRVAGIRDGTIHTELGHLRMILLWAEKHRLIERAPYVERPSKPKPKERHLTRRELQALLDACEMPHVRLFIHLAYATAGRSAAILGLTWARVDFERGKIDLEDPEIKTPHKGRAIVPMTTTLKTRLLEARQGALSPYVIEWAGNRIGSVKRGLAHAARKAGLKKVTPHMLRHSCACHLAEGGIPFEEIAAYLGHKNVSMVRQVYAKFSPDALRQAASILELDDTVKLVSRRTS